MTAGCSSWVKSILGISKKNKKNRNRNKKNKQWNKSRNEKDQKKKRGAIQAGNEDANVDLWGTDHTGDVTVNPALKGIVHVGEPSPIPPPVTTSDTGASVSLPLSSLPPSTPALRQSSETLTTELNRYELPQEHSLFQQPEDHRFSNTSKKDGSSERCLPTLEFCDRLIECRELIKSAYSNCDKKEPTLDDSNTYVPLHTLREMLSREILNDLLKSTKWFKKDMSREIWSHFLCTVAILIVMGWEDWESFANLFYNHLDDKHRYTRSDEQLPYDDEKLRFLSLRDRLSFCRYQYVFKHHMFTEENGPSTSSYKVTRYERLPFTELKLFREGDPSISRAVLDRNGIRKICRLTNEYAPNLKPEIVALKRYCKAGPFTRERTIQHILQNIQAERYKIVVTMTSYIDERESEPRYTLMYEWAATDLGKILLGRELFCHSLQDFSSERFTPLRVVEQLRDLADALAFLHEHKIMHLDMKPENILVYRIGAHNDSEESNVGQWKITDFGLSESLNVRVDGPDSSERPSSVSAPRGPGTYQAPEAFRPGGRVSYETDNWSLGTVLAVSFVFMLGGPSATRKFQRARQQDGFPRDQFFEETNCAPRVKALVWKWMSDLARHQEVQGAGWVHTLETCMTSLLVIEREQRMSAHDARELLREAGDALAVTSSNLHHPWHWTSSAMEAVTLSTCDDITTSPVSTLQPQVECTELVSQLQVQASTLLSQASEFYSLSLAPDPITTQMSAGWVAVLYEKLILFFDLQSIMRSRSQSLVSNGLAIEPSFSHDADVGQTFRAIHLQGNFIAIVWEGKESKESSARYVSVAHLLHSSKAKTTDQVEMVGTWPLSTKERDDCFDVVISAQGTLARLFDDHVRISKKDEEEDYILRDGKNVQAAVFSVAGDYLCIWARGYKSGKNWWRMHDLESLGERPRCQFSDEIDSGLVYRRDYHGIRCQKPHLAPALDGCNFFAYDRSGRIWFLSPQKTEVNHSNMFELKDNAVVLPLSKSSFMALWRDNERIQASAFLGTTARGSAAQPLLESGLPIEFEERDHDFQEHEHDHSGSLSSHIDATITDFDGKSGVVILHGFRRLELRLAHIAQI